MERDIERWLGKQLKQLNCLYYKFVAPGNTGVPDRIVVIPGGTVYFLELKDDVGRLSAEQKVQLSRLKAQGAHVRVVVGMTGARQVAEEIRNVLRAGLTL